MKKRTTTQILPLAEPEHGWMNSIHFGEFDPATHCLEFAEPVGVGRMKHPVLPHKKEVA
jgi:hypothetical protein